MLFDGVTDFLLLLRTLHIRLGANARILENSKIKSALIKVQNRYEHKLTMAKEKTVQHLLDTSFQSRRALPIRTDLANELIKWHRWAS